MLVLSQTPKFRNKLHQNRPSVRVSSQEYGENNTGNQDVGNLYKTYPPVASWINLGLHRLFHCGHTCYYRSHLYVH